MLSKLANMKIYNEISYSPDYVYSLDHMGSSKIVATISDRSIKVFDSTSSLNEINSIPRIHEHSIGGICVIDANCILTCGGDGLVKVWDIRSNRAAAAKFSTGLTSPLISMDYSSLSDHIAAGSELEGQDAGVFIWDMRNTKSYMQKYIDSHNDDVTCVAYHPTDKHTLLSGSTDGLVIRYDSSISDEDDAVMQIINHNASIHKTGFWGEQIYALSHMETFSIYKYTNKEEEDTEESHEDQTIRFNDIRSIWDCEYVVDITDDYIVVGNNSIGHLALLPVRHNTVYSKERIELTGAHGEEVVRCVLPDKKRKVVYSGGEDGNIKIWKPENDGELQDSGHWSQVYTIGKGKRKKDLRFKPY
ncbi:WD40-repeat-containing domain protein [Dipodascopsis uninucleata]